MTVPTALVILLIIKVFVAKYQTKCVIHKIALCYEFLNKSYKKCKALIENAPVSSTKTVDGPHVFEIPGQRVSKMDF